MIDIIKVSIWSIFVFLFFAAAGQLEICLIAYLTALVHELGHITAALIFKYKIKRIEILPVGVCAVTDDTLKNNPLHELVVAASGPAVNLVATVICLGIYKFSGVNTEAAALVNVYMLIINLLPITPLDGGRILNACLAIEFKKKRADAISRIVSLMMLSAVLILGCILFYNTGFNFSLLTAALFLAGNFKMPVHSMRFAQITQNSVCTVCRAKSYILPETISVLEAVREIDRQEICLVYISDINGNIMHTTTNKRLFCAMSDGVYHKKIGELF